MLVLNPGGASPRGVGHRNFYLRVNDFSGHSHGRNIRQMLGMMSRYPLLAARVLEAEHANKLADRALRKKTANKKRKAGGGGDGGGDGDGSACGSAEAPLAAAAVSAVVSALPDAGEGSEVGAAGPYEDDSGDMLDELFMDWDDDTAVEEAAPALAFVPQRFVPTIDWVSWEARRHHWRVFNEIFTDGQVPLQLRSIVRFEDFA